VAIRQRIVHWLVTTEKIGGHIEPDNASFHRMVQRIRTEKKECIITSVIHCDVLLLLPQEKGPLSSANRFALGTGAAFGNCGDLPRKWRDKSGHERNRRATTARALGVPLISDWFAKRKTPTWEQGLRIQAFLERPVRKPGS
jgi:hypothetical protein